MPKFASSSTPVNVTAPVATTSDLPDSLTEEGGPGFTRDPRSELFLLAVTNMVGEATFYEASRDRDRRFAALIHAVARSDPTWIARFVPFLRDTMHLRSASVVMAAEYAAGRLGRGTDGEADEATLTGSAVEAGGATSVRAVISAALSRADEPAEMLAYWHQSHGRRIPQAVKRGIADAARRLYTERAALKYDGESRGYRMGDVLELTHPEPADPRQSALFRLLLDRRHEREGATADAALLPVVAARTELEAMALGDRRAFLEAPDVDTRFGSAGVTWEWLSGWLNGPMDAAAWEAVIPSMGYMALLRNLRNFDDAGVSGKMRERIIARLTDPAEVARSRQLPLRFFSAWKNTQTVHWAPALETALNLSLANVPALAGRTLVLVDVSGSMVSPVSGRSTGQRWEVAALFGVALAARATRADVVAFQTTSTPVGIARGSSVLRGVEAFKPLVGGGTSTFEALEKHYAGHDRIVILTDEQAFPQRQATWRRPMFGGLRFAPAEEITAPIYTFNLAGYRVGHLPSGSHNRYAFGGLTDQGFAAIELLERGRDQDWGTLFRARPEPPADDEAA